MAKNTFLSALMVFTALLPATAHAGKVELTTYYPAPYGEYKELKSTENASFATTSGNVGIGTTTPSGKLDVHGTGTTTGVTFQTADSSGSAKFTILDSGKVGIGIASPAGILDLTSTTLALYPPRVTTAQRDVIASSTVAEPTKAGAVVYNTTTKALEFYNGSTWSAAGGGTTSSGTWRSTPSAGSESCSTTCARTSQTSKLDGSGNLCKNLFNVFGNSCSFTGSVWFCGYGSAPAGGGVQSCYCG